MTVEEILQTNHLIAFDQLQFIYLPQYNTVSLPTRQIPMPDQRPLVSDATLM